MEGNLSLQRLKDLHGALDAHAGVVVTDRRGRILEVNDRFCEMCGYAREELLEQTFRLLHSGVHGSEYYKGLWAHLDEGLPWKGEFCNRAKGGRLYWVSATIVPFPEGEEGPAHFVAIEADITEFKSAKDALLQAQHLQQMGLMASGMAHDFNNLMQALLGGLEGLSTEPSAPERMAALQDVAERCQALAARLMKVGRGPAMAPEWADLNRIVGGLSRVLGQMLRGKHELWLDLSEEAPLAWLDPLQAQQVVLNLVGNARDAMPRGGRIRVATSLVRLESMSAREGSLARGLYIALDVEDEGEGISTEALLRISEPFYTTKLAPQGTGLGLAVTRMILQAHGGALTCTSTVGKGTRMRTYWPVSLGG